MEDRWVVGDVDDAMLVAVFDGHVGAEVAEHAAAVALDAVRHARQRGLTPPALWTDVFARLDPEGAQAGSTATLILVHADRLAVAWVGDSRAVLVGTRSARVLTPGHRIDRSDEVSRCLAAGARLEPPYVVDPRTSYGLMVTRALGDRSLRRIGITPEPETASVKLGRDSVGFVVATDGLWDVVRNAEAAAVCRHHDAQTAADRLVALVDERDGRDNVTVVAARFR
jgi:serine/threonine protein phosphatase PrpC